MDNISHQRVSKFSTSTLKSGGAGGGTLTTVPSGPPGPASPSPEVVRNIVHLPSRCGLLATPSLLLRTSLSFSSSSEYASSGVHEIQVARAVRAACRAPFSCTWPCPSPCPRPSSFCTPSSSRAYHQLINYIGWERKVQAAKVLENVIPVLAQPEYHSKRCHPKRCDTICIDRIYPACDPCILLAPRSWPLAPALDLGLALGRWPLVSGPWSLAPRRVGGGGGGRRAQLGPN